MGGSVEIIHTEPPRKPYNIKVKSSREKAELKIWLSGSLTNRREAVPGVDKITQKVCLVIREKNKERILRNANTYRAGRSISQHDKSKHQKKEGEEKALRRRCSTGSNAIQKEQCPPDSTGRISATLLRAVSVKQQSQKLMCSS